MLRFIDKLEGLLDSYLPICCQYPSKSFSDLHRFVASEAHLMTELVPSQINILLTKLLQQLDLFKLSPQNRHMHKKPNFIRRDNHVLKKESKSIIKKQLRRTVKKGTIQIQRTMKFEGEVEANLGSFSTVQQFKQKSTIHKPVKAQSKSFNGHICQSARGVVTKRTDSRLSNSMVSLRNIQHQKRNRIRLQPGLREQKKLKLFQFQKIANVSRIHKKTKQKAKRLNGSRSICLTAKRTGGNFELKGSNYVSQFQSTY